MNDRQEHNVFLADQIEELELNYLNPLRTDWMKTYIHQEEVRSRPDGPFQRDYSRIMYSSSFRRLQGKMQLLGIKNDQFFRNRLTHSLEVAQIARSIAGMLRYDREESYIVEAGALAHDLGNPPFGHAGEAHMNLLFSDIGGYEGNAQTLRILTNIEKKRPDFRGLNLTYRTLFSVVKYFNRFSNSQGNKQQKFLYDDDYRMLEQFVDKNHLTVRTMDVQIVDIADEIAYAAHDLEDGLRVKAYTIDEVLHDYQTQFGSSDCYLLLKDTVEKSKEIAGSSKNKTDSTQFSKLFRQELASRLINLFLNDISLIAVTPEQISKTGTRQQQELGFLHLGELVNGLKMIIFKCINHNDVVYHYEQKGKEVIDFLYNFYMNDPLYLPPEYRAHQLKMQYDDLSQYNDQTLQKRLICDYIAGMMDSYAIVTYERLSGQTFVR